MLTIFINILMLFLIMENITFVKFGIISSSDIRVLKGKWKYGILVEHNILFNNDFISKYKTTREICRIHNPHIPMVLLS